MTAVLNKYSSTRHCWSYARLDVKIPKFQAFGYLLAYARIKIFD